MCSSWRGILFQFLFLSVWDFPCASPKRIFYELHCYKKKKIDFSCEVSRLPESKGRNLPQIPLPRNCKSHLQAKCKHNKGGYKDKRGHLEDKLQNYLKSNGALRWSKPAIRRPEWRNTGVAQGCALTQVPNFLSSTAMRRLISLAEWLKLHLFWLDEGEVTLILIGPLWLYSCQILQPSCSLNKIRTKQQLRAIFISKHIGTHKHKKRSP